MTDVDLNRRVAEALGWRFEPVADSMEYDWVGPDGIRALCPMYATSLDACFRDLVPEARARGFTLTLQEWGGWQCVFTARSGLYVEADPIPSRALCLAWLQTKQ